MLRKHGWVPFILLIISIIIFTAIPIPAASGRSENDIDLRIPPPLTKGIGSPLNPVRSLAYNEERAVVELASARDANILDLLASSGVEVEASSGELIQIKASSLIIFQIASWDNVKHVRKPNTPIPLEVVSEGVQVIEADKLHNLGLRGEGVKIAVIDLGFNVYNPEIAGNIDEYESFRSDSDITGGSAENRFHGTACAEIVVDTAPSSRLYLYNFETDVEYLMAVDYAISKNVDVISVSVGFLNVGPYDGTNYIDEAANKAKSLGIFFVSAAGNEAFEHWTGTFRDDDNDDFHNFTSEDETNDIVVQEGSVVKVFLSWDDWPSSANDYDLYLYDETSSVIVAESENLQTGMQPPTESIMYHASVPGTYRIVIREANSTNPVRFDLFSLEFDLEYYVEEGSLTSPGDAPGSFTVGATTLDDDEIEPFSSRGPTVDGRIKPDITAPDGVTTYTYGQERFYGTSASAPYASGAAALLLEADPNLSPVEIQQVFEESAADLGPEGKDNIYGAGRLDLYAAYSLLKGYYEKATLAVHAHPMEYRYPSEPPTELNVAVTVHYIADGEEQIIEEDAPFQISVDYGSFTNVTVKTVPKDYYWHEWENYGYENTSSKSITVNMDGNRTLIAYVEYSTNESSTWIILHAHSSSIQYPEEPNEELNASILVSYQFNETNYLDEFNVGPEPIHIQVDRNSNLSIKLARAPSGYEWSGWDLYGVGRNDSETLNLVVDENRTVIAYFNPVEAATGDFFVSVSPQTQVYVPGQIVNYTILVTSVDGFNSSISINIEPSSGVEAYIHPTTILPGGKSVLTLLTDENTPIGPLIITINVDGGGKKHVAQVTLQRWAIPWLKVEEVILGLILGVTVMLNVRRLKKYKHTREDIAVIEVKQRCKNIYLPKILITG